MDGRPRKLDSPSRGMLAFPHEPSRLDVWIVKSLADSIDWATRYTRGTQLRQPLISSALQELFLQDGHKLLAVTHSLWIGGETGVSSQDFTSQQITEHLVEAVIATTDDDRPASGVKRLVRHDIGMAVAKTRRLFP